MQKNGKKKETEYKKDHTAARTQYIMHNETAKIYRKSVCEVKGKHIANQIHS